MAEKTTQDEEIRQLIIERLKSMPADKKISIGADGDFTKDQLIEHVLKKDDVGEKIVEVQMSYLQALKTGVLLDG